ncbi:amidohydrolase family protein [Lentzea sp. NPDC060358]|uniref:amidohydrolase family protein n=1 Tax=Lentzea sp. NPDC060358 TaxID=3347103 RepID=UPI00365D1BC9
MPTSDGRTRTLVRGGAVVTLDSATGDLPRGDVRVEDGRIAAVAARLDVPGADVVDATGKIVLPGFVDSHRHTWQTAFRGVGADWTFAQYGRAVHGTLRRHYRPQDVYLGTLLGRIETLDSGVTTMLDWFHCADRPDNADAAVQALREAPGRSLFCYGAGSGDDPIAHEIRRVRDRVPGDDMVLGLRGPVASTIGTTAADVALARELDLRVSVHVHGATGWPHGDRPIADMRDRGLLDDRTTVVHGNGLSDDQFAMLADHGCTVSISPDVELKMGHGWPVTGRALAAGIRPSLSVDDCPSAGGDMFSAMRTAFAVARGSGEGVTARDVLEFATLNGAVACGRGSRAGSITPGKDADLVLLDAEAPAVFPVGNAVGTIVTAAHPGLVDTVFVGGRVVKRDGRLVGADLAALRERVLQSRDRIAAAAGIAVDGSWVPAGRG